MSVLTSRRSPLFQSCSVLDDEGMVLSRIVYGYDADGRLSQEKLTTENPPLPKEFRDQIRAISIGLAVRKAITRSCWKISLSGSKLPSTNGRKSVPD